MSRRTLDSWANSSAGQTGPNGTGDTTIKLSKEAVKKLQILKIKYNTRSYEETILKLVEIVENGLKDPIKERLCGEYWGLKTGPYPAKGWITIFLKTGVLEENSDGTFTLSEEFCRGYIPVGEGSV